MVDAGHFLQKLPNRCRLVVISDARLDERNCKKALAFYGSIKHILLTSDRRAAFVDYECEHAPLLVARCFALHLRNPEVPMPKGVSTLLPGCSLGNFLYLHDVPRLLPTAALELCFNSTMIYRAGIAGSDALYPVVVRYANGVEVSLKRICRFSLNWNVDDYKFFAVPHLASFTDTNGILDSGGCDQCNIGLKSSIVEMEGGSVIPPSTGLRDIVSSELIDAAEVEFFTGASKLDLFNTRVTSNGVKFCLSPEGDWKITPPTSQLPPSLCVDESESCREPPEDPKSKKGRKRRNRKLRAAMEVEVAPEVEGRKGRMEGSNWAAWESAQEKAQIEWEKEQEHPLAVSTEVPAVESEDRQRNDEREEKGRDSISDYLQKDSHRRLLVVIGRDTLEEKNCRNYLSAYGSIEKIALTSDRRAAFVDFKCDHSPLLVARCYQMRRARLPMDAMDDAARRVYEQLQFGGVAALLPGCSINNFLYLQFVPRSLSSEALRRYFEFDDETATVYRAGTIAKPSSRVVIELRRNIAAAAYHGNCMKCCKLKDEDKPLAFYAIPNLPQLTDCSNVISGGGCADCRTDAYKALLPYAEPDQARPVSALAVSTASIEFKKRFEKIEEMENEERRKKKSDKWKRRVAGKVNEEEGARKRITEEGEEEQQVAPRTPVANGSEHSEETADQSDIASSLDQTIDLCTSEDECRNSDDISSISSYKSIIVLDSDDDEEASKTLVEVDTEGKEKEREQEDSVEIPRRLSTDRSERSEYLSWLTRDSLGDCSSDSDAEKVPPPSSPSATSWGRGIEIVETTAESILEGEKGRLPTERKPIQSVSNAFGRVMPTFEMFKSAFKNSFRSSSRSPSSDK